LNQEHQNKLDSSPSGIQMGDIDAFGIY